MLLQTIELPSVRIERRAVRRIDYWLLTAVLVLNALSLPLIDSATHSAQGHYYAKKQALLVLVSLVVLVLGTFLDYRDLVRLSPWLYGFSIVLLVSLFFIGKTINYSTRWISFVFFDLQPSEISKLVTILFSAYLLSRRDEPISNVFGLIWYYLWLLPPVLLILKQPDLGTALVLLVISVGILYFSGVSGTLLLKMCVISVIICVIVVSLHLYTGLPIPLEDYQVDRILSIFGGQKDPLGRDYQVLQSKIAIGSGMLWGKGMGQGTQIKLDFIPEQQTDFIFSVVGEELGFVRAIGVLFLYMMLIYRCLLVALNANDIEGTLGAGGIACMFWVHVVVNIGMTMGIIPVTGIPLPFLSHGGSALLVNSFSVGLILNISWKRHKILF